VQGGKKRGNVHLTTRFYLEQAAWWGRAGGGVYLRHSYELVNTDAVATEAGNSLKWRRLTVQKSLTRSYLRRSLCANEVAGGDGSEEPPTGSHQRWGETAETPSPPRPYIHEGWYSGRRQKGPCTFS